MKLIFILKCFCLPIKGAPKQAEIAILGSPFLAIEKFETKSNSEFPQANIVIPTIASLKLKAIPIDYERLNN